MKQWCMVIDVEKCENCNNCFLACKDEHVDNDWEGITLAQARHGHRWMNILRKEQGIFPNISVAYLPKPCYHCADAPCVQQCSHGEIIKRDDGIVLIDPERARGKKELVKACPHGAIFWNEATQTPQKCTLCAHLLDDGWKAPRCVQACPTGALTFHSLEAEEMTAFIADNKLEPPPNTTIGEGSVVYYKNTHLFYKGFIAGSVATREKGIEECVPNLTVTLSKDEKKVDQTTTDGFGDYRFTNIPLNSGTYTIVIARGDEPLKEISYMMEESGFAETSWIGY
ncbi:MAG: hypothetical protein QM498_06540 [Desulfobacterium sp.]